MASRVEIKAPPIEQGPKFTVGPYLPIDSIRTDGGTQARAGLDEATVAEYAEAWLTLSHRQNGFLEMPPIIVFHDGEAYWLADGFHRVEAYKRFVNGPSASASPHAIRADIRSGTRREAVLFACGANASHGLKRTTEDKRRAIERVLGDEEWRQWSDSEIARRVNVDHKTVASVRAELVTTGEIPSSSMRQSADGKVRDVTGIRESNARRKVTPTPTPHPDYQHMAAVERILKEAAGHGERTGTAMYQQAYDQARNIRDVTLYNRAFAMIDRAVDGEPAKKPTPPAPILTVHNPALWAVADASYSADRLSNGKMKKPFAYDGRLWIGVGGHYAGGLSGARVEDCVCVVPVGTAYTPGVPNKDYRTGSYCGDKAHYGGVQYELTGQWLIVHNNGVRPANTVGETDLDAELMARLTAKGYHWEHAKQTPDGRWHHVISARNQALLRNDQVLLRRERIVALLAPAAALGPAATYKAAEASDLSLIAEAAAAGQAPDPAQIQVAQWQAEQAPSALWFGATRGRIIATVDLFRWCAAHVGELDLPRRDLLIADLEQATAELKALIEALARAA